MSSALNTSISLCRVQPSKMPKSTMPDAQSKDECSGERAPAADAEGAFSFCCVDVLRALSLAVALHCTRPQCDRAECKRFTCSCYSSAFLAYPG
eukprot:6188209-Pleurochrysis_carterae.AAC.2